MEPRPFSRGNWIVPEYKPTVSMRFNGAAAFQPRKLVAGEKIIPPVNCFNGAAAFQPRKQRIPPSRSLRESRLQWSRGLSAAETNATVCRQCEPRGFNGAAAFQPRKHQRQVLFPAGAPPGFNGAAAFQPRKPTGRSF